MDIEYLTYPNGQERFEMAIKAWIHWIDGYQKQAAHEVLALLTQQGIEVQSFDAYLSSGIGVIFSREVTTEICEQLRELSRNGQIQVLACCEASIPCDVAWRLMEAGASDVLMCKDCRQVVHQITARLQRWEKVNRMENAPAMQNAIVGESQALKAILRQVIEVAHFTDSFIP
jgi:hypothetical protein